jgi:hypothetical protein
MILEKHQPVELAGQHRLLITRSAPGTLGGASPAGDTQEDTLCLMNSDGAIALTIRVGLMGATIEVGGDLVGLKVAGDLAIDARRLSLHGREHVSITSGGDATVRIAQTLTHYAARQSIVSTLGDLTLYANDDVKVDGERIRMNC